MLGYGMLSQAGAKLERRETGGIKGGKRDRSLYCVPAEAGWVQVIPFSVVATLFTNNFAIATQGLNVTIWKHSSHFIQRSAKVLVRGLVQYVRAS